MTREEAVKYILEWLKDEYALTEKDRIALNIAVDSIKDLEEIKEIVKGDK